MKFSKELNEIFENLVIYKQVYKVSFGGLSDIPFQLFFKNKGYDVYIDHSGNFLYLHHPDNDEPKITDKDITYYALKYPNLPIKEMQENLNVLNFEDIDLYDKAYQTREIDYYAEDYMA